MFIFPKKWDKNKDKNKTKIYIFFYFWKGSNNIVPTYLYEWRIRVT